MPNESPNEHPAIDLRQIVVRPILREEKDAFKSLLAQHHYLGPAPLIGQSIQYLACVQDRWLALLVFAAAALKSQAARPLDRLAPLFSLATPPFTGQQHPVSHPAGLFPTEPRLESPVPLHETDRGRLAPVPWLPLTSRRNLRRSCPLPRDLLQGRRLARAWADPRVSQVQYTVCSA